MKNATEPQARAVTTVAARVAGEDIANGDYVTTLTEIIELPSYLWDDSMVSQPTDEPVRIRYLPSSAGVPHKVVAVCLPFVYAKRPRGDLVTLDTRKHQLVRLDSAAGRSLWKQMRKKVKRKPK